MRLVMNRPITSPSNVLASSPAMASSGARREKLNAPSTVLWSVSASRSSRHSRARSISCWRELRPSCEKWECRCRSTRSIREALDRGGFFQHSSARAPKQRDHLRGLAAETGLLHQRRLRVVDDLHHLLRTPLTTKPRRERRMRVTKDRHQSRYQPAGNDADLLHETLFDPVEQLIRLLQQASRCHRTPTPSMPALISLLLLDRLLKHGPQPTISATCRDAGPCRITQRSPSTRGRDQGHLAVEGKLHGAETICGDEPRRLRVLRQLCPRADARRHPGAPGRRQGAAGPGRAGAREAGGAGARRAPQKGGQVGDGTTKVHTAPG